MPRFRFSLAGLSGLVLLAGIAAAAARSPSEAWANGAFSLAVLVLGLASLRAAFGRGLARDYWRGFTVMGWGYLFLAFGPWSDVHIAPLLLTKTIGELLHGRFMGLVEPGTGRVFYRIIPESQLFMFGYQQIGHALTALLAGLIGGSLARRLAARAEGPAVEGDR